VTTLYEKRTATSRASLADDDVHADDSPLLTYGAAASSRHVWLASGLYRSSHGTWRAIVRARIVELASRPEDWDSYGGLRLQQRAVEILLVALDALDGFIGQAPVVSLTADGGLICAWASGEYSLDLEADGTGRLSAYFVDRAAGVEHDIEVLDGSSLDKWVWLATSRS